MKSSTEYLWFERAQRRDLANITDQVSDVVRQSGIREGLCLVSAMHITAGVWVNDNEPGLWEDLWEWLERLASPYGCSVRRSRTGASGVAARRVTRGAPAGAAVVCC